MLFRNRHLCTKTPQGILKVILVGRNPLSDFKYNTLLLTMCRRRDDLKKNYQWKVVDRLERAWGLR